MAGSDRPRRRGVQQPTPTPPTPPRGTAIPPPPLDSILPDALVTLECTTCSTRYRRSLPKGSTFECPKCSTLLIVPGGKPSPQPPKPAKEQWYAVVNDQPAGPFDLSALRWRIAEGDVARDTLVWKDGMGDWAPLITLPLGAELFGAEPYDPDTAISEEHPMDLGEAAQALDESDLADEPEPGGSTGFIIAQAGVTNRNPPWKIAVVIGGVALVGFGVFGVLTALHVVTPFATTRAPEQPQEAFTAKPPSGSDVAALLDAEKRASAASKSKSVTGGATGSGSMKNGQKGSTGKGGKPGTLNAAEAYAMLGGKADVNLRHRETEPTGASANTKVDPATEAAMAVIASHRATISDCVSRELKLNPSAKLGDVWLVLQVASNGRVEAASLKPETMSKSTLGQCITARAKHFAFAPTANGMELESPLKLMGQ